MKTFFRGISLLLIAAAVVGCDAFHTLNKKKSAQGRPYELIVVCPQMEWNGELGDSLRAVFTAPVPYLNQAEPLFDVLRVTERGFKDMIADHRNILKVVVDPEVQQAEAAVEYNVTSEPQIVVTLQGPDDKALVEYLSQNRNDLLHVLEQAERDRDVQAYTSFNNPGIEAAIRKLFGVEIKVPKGYVLAKQTDDFLWARYEYPTASQGFFVYSYPYEGPESLSLDALIKARNKFAALIPGPSDGSYMITSDAFEPDYRLFRLEGRLWCELRGFWDVEGDFMGGPFVSYTTVDTETNRVFTLDGYVYAPDLNKPRKRNYIRGIEHLLYTIHFPEQSK
ncbi:MAG TPA: DUF4837 family protein [Candidatus Alistipes intestinigallinarum]|uniref:DUF4837 family protein n=1 Tax=Candidatus Alistipes intestinigallinarum TaxID=2838440 RepID=A0A9D1YZD4_9BACT|nr:DUF4837 family protein [Candidatus Alistipes intestinigallinarum]